MSPSLSDATKGRLGLAVVFGLSWGLFSLHVAHAVGGDENLLSFLFGIFLPMTFSAGVFLGGIWLLQSDFAGSQVLRVGAWCLTGVVVLATGSVFTILYQQAGGVVMYDRVFVVVNGASGGLVVGFVVGIYNVGQRTARTRSERLTRRLTVLNRVLRHDVRNGANVIHGNAELLSDRPDATKQTETIRQHALRLVEVSEHARELELLYNDPNESNDVVDVGAVLERLLERIECDRPELVIDASLPSTETVDAHPMIEAAIKQVLSNAIEHSDANEPRISVDYSLVEHEGTEWVEIQIADNGPGIPEGERAVLERGYETPLEHTSGLGLWLVNWIVTDSGGDVRFAENSTESSVVRLRFELANPGPSEPSRSIRRHARFLGLTPRR